LNSTNQITTPKLLKGFQFCVPYVTYIQPIWYVGMTSEPETRFRVEFSTGGTLLSNAITL